MKKRYRFSLKNCLSFGVFVALTAFGSPELQAQNGPAVQWDRTFGGIDLDALSVVQQTPDGGYIVGGWSLSNRNADKSHNSKGFADYWVIKLDSNGNKIWDKTIGGNGADYLTTLVQTSDGGYILGGHSNSGISGDKTSPFVGSLGAYEDYWIVKLDANGNKIWDKSFGGSKEDNTMMIVPTTDGGYIIGGQSSSDISGDKSEMSRGSCDFWLIKIDAIGNKVWDKTLGSSGIDYFRMIQQTSDGGYIVGGNSYAGISGEKTQPSKGSDDYWIIKLDANGNKVWDKVLGSNSPDILVSVEQTIDGGYILSGGSGGGISGDKTQSSIGCGDFWLVKLNPSGSKLWDKTFGGNGCEGGGATQLSNGNYIIYGSSSSGISGDKTQTLRGQTDFWLVNINPTGNIHWDKTLGGAGEDYLSSVQQTFDGGYILGGSSNSGISGDKSQPSKGNRDFWIVKLAPDVLGTKELQPTFTLTLSPTPAKANSA